MYVPSSNLGLASSMLLTSLVPLSDSGLTFSSLNTFFSSVASASDGDFTGDGLVASPSSFFSSEVSLLDIFFVFIVMAGTTSTSESLDVGESRSRSYDAASTEIATSIYRLTIRTQQNVIVISRALEGITISFYKLAILLTMLISYLRLQVFLRVPH